jgi:hypothetical protein
MAVPAAVWRNRDLVTVRLRAVRQARAYRGELAAIRTTALFVGYPRSGHSLVGSLLDAHPNAAVAHELNMLRLVRAGFSRDQVLATLLARAHFPTGESYWPSSYDYRVPGGHQGRWDEPRLVADKKGPGTTRLLEARPGLLDKLRRLTGLPVRLVHVVRNPFDTMSTMLRRRGTGNLPTIVDDWFSLADGVLAIRTRLAAEEWVPVRYEALLAAPEPSLGELCERLGLRVDQPYLEACASIIWPSAKRTREDAPWTDDLIADVQARFARYDFLDGYTFDD